MNLFEAIRAWSYPIFPRRGRISNFYCHGLISVAVPCQRREREATWCNSTELCGMDSTLPQLKDQGDAY